MGGWVEPAKPSVQALTLLPLRGKRTIDLAVDPPPDLALEIDIPTRRDHTGIYAALGVPEL